MEALKLILAVLFVVLLSGCDSTNQTYAPRFAPNVELITAPEIGVVSTVSIGETLFTHAKVNSTPAINLQNKLTAGDGIFTPKVTLTPGIYLLESDIEKWSLYYPENAEDFQHHLSLGVKTRGGLAVGKDGTTFKLFTEMLPISVSAKTREKPIIEHFISKNRKHPIFQQELVYNGMSGDTLKFLYRELYDDMMRTPFHQNLSYDISTGKIIGFKDIRIEVIEASNVSIRYRRLPEGTPYVAASEGSTPTETSAVVKLASGTGFYITNQGHILTNFHVIDEAKSISVLTSNGDAFEAEILFKDKSNDLALLKVGSDSVPMSINFDQMTKVGSEVFTMGFPRIDSQGSSLKSTFGRVNSLSGLDDDIRFFQIDVPIQPGNSGGPLVDKKGNVVGIMTSTLSPLFVLANSGSLPQNVNYAIKADYAKPLTKQLSLKEIGSVELGFVELIERAGSSIVSIRTTK